MSFACNDCHLAATGRTLAESGHLFRSDGRCENCGRMVPCGDCQCAGDWAKARVAASREAEMPVAQSVDSVAYERLAERFAEVKQERDTLVFSLVRGLAEALGDEHFPIPPHDADYWSIFKRFIERIRKLRLGVDAERAQRVAAYADADGRVRLGVDLWTEITEMLVRTPHTTSCSWPFLDVPTHQCDCGHNDLMRRIEMPSTVEEAEAEWAVRFGVHRAVGGQCQSMATDPEGRPTQCELARDHDGNHVTTIRGFQYHWK